MLGKISIFFVLVGLLFGVYPLYAQDTQTDVTLEISKLNEQIKKLNEEIQELNKQIQDLKKSDYEYVSLKLKDDMSKWLIAIAGFFGLIITLLTILGGKSYIESKVKNTVEPEVAKTIAGERERFDEALQNIEAARQEIESTKEEMKEIQYNQVRFILAGGQPNENLAKHLPLELVLKVLEYAESDELILIQSAIYSLGFKEYQDEAQAKKSVQAILNYLDLSQTQGTLTSSIDVLGRIGTQKAFDELIKFYKSLPESEETPKGANVIYIRSDILETLGEMGKQEAIPLLKELIFKHESLESGWGTGILALKQIWERNAEARETAEATLKEIYETTQIAGMKNCCLEALKTMSPEASKWAEERKA